MPDSSHNGPPPALCLTPAFGELLAGFDLDALARQPDTIIGLDADLRLAFLNPAWFAFAEANGGGPAIARDWGLGRCVLDPCRGAPSKNFQLANFPQRALRLRAVELCNREAHMHQNVITHLNIRQISQRHLLTRARKIHRAAPGETLALFNGNDFPRNRQTHAP